MLIGADGEIKLRVFLDVIDTGEGPLPRDGYGQICSLKFVNRYTFHEITYGAFTLDVNSLLNENLGGILGGTQC